MSPFRIVFLVCSALAIGGATYLAHFGIWGESMDLDRSVRVGSNGGGFIGGRVK